MNLANHFHNGLLYDDFLTQHGTDAHRSNWNSVYEAVSLSDTQTETIKAFTREMRVLCFAGAWCGDCVEQCPILQRIAELNDFIELRFVDRDASEELKESMILCGGARVPQMIIFSEEDFFVSRYGDRTLAKYRQMAGNITGAACSTGITLKDDPLQQAVIQEWIDQFERAQLILRTSARLREKHGD